MAKKAPKAPKPKAVQPKPVDEAPPAEAPEPEPEPEAVVPVEALAETHAPPTEYPAWRYHRSEPARLVQDEAGHRALGPGWAWSPDAFKESK